MGRAILVTGAGGLVGSHVCEAFGAAGWEVRALDRPGADCAAARQAGGAVETVDLARPEGALFVADRAKGAALLVHAAFPEDDDATAAVAMLRAAAAAAVAAGAPLVLLSSCTVYGRPRNLPCDEGEVKDPAERHGRARWAVEREAWHWRRTRGLRLVVLRPAMTYGPRQRRGLAAALVVAALAAHRERALWVPRRGPIVHTVHAADVGQAALLVAEHGAGRLDGRAFNVADDVPLPLEELGRALLAAAGAREAGRIWYAPGPARAFLWLLRASPRWLVWRPLNRRLARSWMRAYGATPPAPPPRVDPAFLEQLAADRYYDTSRLRLLGFSPRVPSAMEGLARLAAESRAAGLLPAAPGPAQLASRATGS